ncbi:LysR family transcriptional regulator [Shewanella sp. VB17]|uniref:LysR family transcriptional regulator n=1 Tax=Shewanella sp. VB17 TaxID=2739432 RepID=UPI0015677B89|nr:LysR family transcriptional regulator [Shewanella sp. VB17]NRD75116.1 LysR family transcriptional regulator [Shewanella sp. VB17]
MIELRHLRTLVALKESGSLAAAAKKRFVTQSALSHQIKELETKIKASIFIRKSTPLSFTQEGIKLLTLADEILPKVNEIEYELKQGFNNVENRLAVGIECHSCFRWLMPAMAQFRNLFPKVNVDLSSRYLFNSLNALENGDLDLVLTSDPVADKAIYYQHLFDFEVKLVVANDHPLAAQNFVIPHQLEKKTIISYPVPLKRLDLYRHFMEPAGVKAGEQISCDLTMMLLQRIACRDGVAALPNWSISESYGLNLTSVKLGEDGLIRPLYGAYRKDGHNRSLAQKWLKLVTYKHNQ